VLIRIPVGRLPAGSINERPSLRRRSTAGVYAHHGSPELVPPRPSSLITAQPQHSLKAKGTGPVLLTRQPVHGVKPIGQRFASVLENRARCHRRLVTTCLALHQHRPHRPEMVALATRTAKPIRPAQPEQVLPTGLLGVKPSLELAQTPRIFLHSPPYYMLGSPESSKYPPQSDPRRSVRFSWCPFSLHEWTPTVNQHALFFCLTAGEPGIILRYRNKLRKRHGCVSQPAR